MKERGGWGSVTEGGEVKNSQIAGDVLRAQVHSISEFRNPSTLHRRIIFVSFCARGLFDLPFDANEYGASVLQSPQYLPLTPYNCEIPQCKPRNRLSAEV